MSRAKQSPNEANGPAATESTLLRIVQMDLETAVGWISFSPAPKDGTHSNGNMCVLSCLAPATRNCSSES
jgi:hypothetical protein